MGERDFFYQALVYLTAAVVSVPVARRLGLGSVLGYLIAGVAIGPFGLGLVGTEGQDVLHFAEFGVVMMLFVIDLELQPAMLWQMRGALLGLGGLQVAATALVLGSAAVAMGLEWRAAIAIEVFAAWLSVVGPKLPGPHAVEPNEPAENDCGSSSSVCTVRPSIFA